MTDASAASFPPSKFKIRSLHFLRVSRDCVVPLRLFLASPHTFTDMLFEEVLAVLKESLFDQLRFSSTTGDVVVVSQYTPSSPAQYTKPHLQFFYYWSDSSRQNYRVVVPSEDGKEWISTADPDAPIPIPGAFQNFKVCRQALIVVVMPNNSKDKVLDAFDLDFWQSAGIESHQISKFFDSSSKRVTSVKKTV